MPFSLPGLFGLPLREIVSQLLAVLPLLTVDTKFVSLIEAEPAAPASAVRIQLTTFDVHNKVADSSSVLYLIVQNLLNRST